MRPAAGTRCLVRLAACLLLAALAASCAPRQMPGPVADNASGVWQAFVRSASAPAPPAFSLRATFYYTRQERTNRTRLFLWGDTQGPLRLDVTAGVGAPLAYFRETTTGWLAYYPGENRAYRHPDPRTALPAMRMNIPFSLAELGRVLTGRIASLLPGSYAAATPAEDGTTTYRFAPGARISSLTLDASGRARSFSGGEDPAWRVDIERYADRSAPPRPDRLRIDLGEGHFARLLVKEYAPRASPWPDARLELELPPETPVFFLAPPTPG